MSRRKTNLKKKIQTRREKAHKEAMDYHFKRLMRQAIKDFHDYCKKQESYRWN